MTENESENPLLKNLREGVVREQFVATKEIDTNLFLVTAAPEFGSLVGVKDVYVVARVSPGRKRETMMIEMDGGPSRETISEWVADRFALGTSASLSLADLILELKAIS